LVALSLVLLVIVLLALVIIALSDTFGALFGFALMAAACIASELDGI